MARRPHIQGLLRIAWLLVAAVAAGIGLALAAGGAGTAAVSAKPQWVLRDLGTWPGGKQSWAAAVNDRGQVVVLSETAQSVKVGDQALPVMRAFLWEKGRMRDLGARFGGPGSWASAINARSQVVGGADTKAIAQSGHHVTHAFLWEKGKVRDLGTLARGESTYATAVNEGGQVVGDSCRDTRGAPDCRAFLWKNGRMTDLGQLDVGWGLLDVNEHGQIVGTARTGAFGKDGSPIRRAFLWQNGKMTHLGTLGGARSWASAINERGQVVGSAATTAKSKGASNPWLTGMPIAHAFLWQDGKMRDLGTLGGEYSSADAINERGQVVGTADTKTGSHVFLWSSGRMRDLGSFGGPNSVAKAINDRGQVVGGSDTTARKGNPIRHAFVWENGRLTDLGTLGGSSEAVAINARGQIIGWSETKSGAVHAVLWTTSSGR